MQEQERFAAVMHYQLVDRRPCWTVGVWEETLRRWYGEGLPEGQDPHEYLGVKVPAQVNVSGETLAWPPFETAVLEDHETYAIERDAWGRTVRRLKGVNGVPEWLEYPVKSPGDLRRVLDERFAVDEDALEARYPEGWEARAREANEGDKIVSVNAGWYYWTLRSLSGVETASYLLHDAPELVEELFERINVIALDGIARAAQLTRLDYICFGEDIAYKNGPFMSPGIHRRLLIPRYRKVMDLGRSHGCDLGMMGSDGDLRLFIPDYLEVGVNWLDPCEVAAGMVPAELRKEFGRDLRMSGGLDKRAVAAGPEAIDREIERNRVVIEEGGYLPTIDHSVSADISWSNYCYFIEAMRKVWGEE